METIILFAVVANHDRAEGRGPSYDLCYSKSLKIANEIAAHPDVAAQYAVMGQRRKFYLKSSG